MRLWFTTDAEEFADRTAGFVESSLDCNVLATVLADLREGLYRDRRPWFAWGCSDEDHDVRFAALRTPPWPMLTSVLHPDAADELVRRWLERDPELPGVNGDRSTAVAIAEAWSGHTGGSTRRRMSEAMHALERVTEPPRPATGQLRLAHDGDRELLVDWMALFVKEAGLPAADRAAAMIDVRLSRGLLLVWEDGAPVSMVALQRPIAGVVRLGPVFTPVEHRRRGYASAVVAAASRRALAAGASRCMLFTDLANPTSNKIYAEVGYRRLADWEMHDFIAR